MRRVATPIAAICAIAFATTGCTSLGLQTADSATAANPTAATSANDDADNAANPSYASLMHKLPSTLDGEIRRAQLLRLKGDYKGAVHSLSQLMLIAPDDPRIVGEYGKVLTQQGRSQAAVAFLNRAIQLQPDNWTLYSALGVAYDQLDQRGKAQGAYEHALTLKPDNPTVLNNYAMSQMMAGHLDHAEKLLHRAAAHGGDYPKIANNLQMIAAMRAKQGQPAKAESAAATAPTPSPKQALARAKLPAIARPHYDPRKLTAVQAMAARPDVVMEKVPFDPMAGKVYGHDGKVAEAQNPAPTQKLAEADSKPAAQTAQHVGPAADNPPPLRTAADLY